MIRTRVAGQPTHSASPPHTPAMTVLWDRRSFLSGDTSHPLVSSDAPNAAAGGGLWHGSQLGGGGNLLILRRGSRFQACVEQEVEDAAVLEPGASHRCFAGEPGLF